MSAVRNPGSAATAPATASASAPALVPKADWHWPQFGAVICGTLTDRERLGLPDRYVPTPWVDGLAQAFAEQRGLGREALLALLASPEASLGQRISSGNLLALLGDPRIDTLQPAMVDVPGGAVPIGLSESDIDTVMDRFSGLGLNRRWIEKECPRHTVSLAPFRLGRYPVTNAEYRDFLLASGHPELPSSWAFRQYPYQRANHPVYTVTANAADAYARWLSRRTGRGFRLPSEAEWEWAAAGPQSLEFPWGSNFDADRANTAETGLFDTSPVGAFVGGESPFGLADMAGNVEEYVDGDYAPYPGGPRIDDDLVQIHGAYRVARGGCFARFRDLARTRRRHGQNPRSATYAMGFRLAETC